MMTAKQYILNDQSISLFRLLTAVETSATSKIFEMAPSGSSLEKVKLNNMDDTSYAGTSAFSLAVENPKHAIWFDHTTAQGSDEYLNCQVSFVRFSQIGGTLEFYDRHLLYVNVKSAKDLCHIYNYLTYVPNL